MRAYLRKAREDLGYTQQYVAEQIGISQNYYCDIENGTRQRILKIDIIKKLSKLFGVSIETIVLEEEKIMQEETSENE